MNSHKHIKSFAPWNVLDDQFIVYRCPPCEWRFGFPLGNGEIGAMLWGDGAPLKINLDASGLWDLRCNTAYMNQKNYSYKSLIRLVAEKRFDELDETFEFRPKRDNPASPVKIHAGRAELDMGRALDYECRLDLKTAAVQGRIRTKTGNHAVMAFVARGVDVVCLRVTGLARGRRLRLRGLVETTPAFAGLGLPPPMIVNQPGLKIMLQSFGNDQWSAVAWNPAGPDFFIAIVSAPTRLEAREQAERNWRRAFQRGLDKIFSDHCARWRAYWRESAVALPDRTIEYLWHMGSYLLSSMVRPDTRNFSGQGLWPKDGEIPPWRGNIHANEAIQEAFWPACPTGHLEIIDCFCEMMKANIPRAQAFTRHFFGTEGTFWPTQFLPEYTLVPANCWPTVQYCWSSTAFMAWLVWLRWRHSMDLNWLKTVGYPVISEVFKFYAGALRLQKDGFLHIPLSSSPEYNSNQRDAWHADPNIDLALIRRCCDWVVEMETALGIRRLTQAARRVRRQLLPYHLSEKGELCLWKNQLPEHSHWHPSHMMAIHPGMDITLEDGKQARRIIEASWKHWLSLSQWQWAGHTYAQIVSFAAVLGLGEMAHDFLWRYAQTWIGPNGLHLNTDWRGTGSTRHASPDMVFDVTPGMGITAGICDMLVQGWRDIVRVFPAVPKHWRNAAFRNLLTEGAFRVSAVRHNGETVWIQISAGVDRLLRLKNPFGRRPMRITGARIRRERDLILCRMKAGQTITLSVADQPVRPWGRGCAERRSSGSLLGL